MIYVMDSSAMIAFPRNEPGAATVAGMLTDPQNECCAHALNLCEAFYDFARSGGEAAVQSAIKAVIGRQAVEPYNRLAPRINLKGINQ